MPESSTETEKTSSSKPAAVTATGTSRLFASVIVVESGVPVLTVPKATVLSETVTSFQLPCESAGPAPASKADRTRTDAGSRASAGSPALRVSVFFEATTPPAESKPANAHDLPAGLLQGSLLDILRIMIIPHCGAGFKPARQARGPAGAPCEASPGCNILCRTALPGPCTERTTMRRYLFALLLMGALTWSHACAMAGDPRQDPLWQKAVELSEKSKDLVPGTIESFMQEVDKHGEPKDAEKNRRSWGKLYLRDDGEIEYEPVKVIKDGEDITEEERARDREREEEKDGESESFSTEGYSPFAADAQERISIERLDETELIGEQSLVVYEFVERPEGEGGEEVTGTAWFDAETGIPTRIEYTTDPLPKRVKRMITTIEYDYSEPDTLVAGRMILDASGGFLFIKKHFHVEMKFDDYWRLPEGYEEPGKEGR